MKVTRILAVRHGQTSWNREGRLQGHTDIPLDDHGQWQAGQLARALSEEAITACYASDLSRAFDTAQSVASLHQLTVQAHAGLRERCFGVFEGRTWNQIETEHPSEALAWRKRVPEFAPPAGESLVQLQDRVVKTVTELASRHPGEQILMVAHGGVLDILYRAATRLGLQAARSWELPNTAINRLLWTPEGITLVGWADTQHLQDPPTGVTLDERSA